MRKGFMATGLAVATAASFAAGCGESTAPNPVKTNTGPTPAERAKAVFEAKKAKDQAKVDKIAQTAVSKIVSRAIKVVPEFKKADPEEFKEKGSPLQYASQERNFGRSGRTHMVLAYSEGWPETKGYLVYRELSAQYKDGDPKSVTNVIVSEYDVEYKRDSTGEIVEDWDGMAVPAKKDTNVNDTYRFRLRNDGHWSFTYLPSDDYGQKALKSQHIENPELAHLYADAARMVVARMGVPGVEK